MKGSLGKTYKGNAPQVQEVSQILPQYLQPEEILRETQREGFILASQGKEEMGKGLREILHQRLSWDFQLSPAPDRGPPTSFLSLSVFLQICSFLRVPIHLLQ